MGREEYECASTTIGLNINVFHKISKSIIKGKKRDPYISFFHILVLEFGKELQWIYLQSSEADSRSSDPNCLSILQLIFKSIKKGRRDPTKNSDLHHALSSIGKSCLYSVLNWFISCVTATRCLDEKQQSYQTMQNAFLMDLRREFT